MLSILIPIYNINCVKLVADIHKQCQKTKINFEILCYDDLSKNSIRDKNKVLAHLFGVSYVELNENKGRAKIRNMLARYSNHDYMLFIDADSKTPNKSFIKNYLPLLRSDLVVFGGRSYTKRKPTALKKIFHWTYGNEREALKAKKRNRDPYTTFMSNNFIVPRNIFIDIGFDAIHEGYGYEDTQFATELQNRHIKVFHTDNPLIHTGIENIDVFLNKTREAIKNLVILHKEGKILDTKLIRFYKNIIRWKLDNFVKNYIHKRIDKIEANLYSEKPNMRNFDLWKLYLFMQEIEGKN